jgi:hypothetical protein
MGNYCCLRCAYVVAENKYSLSCASLTDADIFVRNNGELSKPFRLCTDLESLVVNIVHMNERNLNGSQLDVRVS